MSRSPVISSFEDLEVWQVAMELVELVYSATHQLPADERYGLCSQIRRAAVSIPANIAEGNGRMGRKEYARYVAMAHGSLCELETLVRLADRIYSLEATPQIAGHCQSVGKMLTRLRKALEAPLQTSSHAP